MPGAGVRLMSLQVGQGLQAVPHCLLAQRGGAAAQLVPASGANAVVSAGSLGAQGAH